MVLQLKHGMDKYLTIILIFMFVGIPIAFVSPSTGEIRNPPFYVLFWVSIGGVVAIFLYDAYKTRKQRQNTYDKRKRNKKR